jgi:hypothetical protein
MVRARARTPLGCRHLARGDIVLRHINDAICHQNGSNLPVHQTFPLPSPATLFGYSSVNLLREEEPKRSWKDREACGLLSSTSRMLGSTSASACLGTHHSRSSSFCGRSRRTISRDESLCLRKCCGRHWRTLLDACAVECVKGDRGPSQPVRAR